jgi:Mitochondrial K+-H+ exchange-related
MDVYLIPTTTPGRYELYYEAPDEEVVDDEDDKGLLSRLTFGVSTRLTRRFSAMLIEAEEWRQRRHEAQSDTAGFLVRVRRKIMGFVVERIAEQRLLWHMRKASEVCACIPEDMGADAAGEVIRTMLKTDRDRHFKWLLIDFALLIPSAALTVVPGPNVLGLYFTFQVVSHYLSWAGAKQGLAISPWTFKPSPDLAALRTVMSLGHSQRHQKFREIAARLRLEHLSTFLDDVAAPPA